VKTLADEVLAEVSVNHHGGEVEISSTKAPIALAVIATSSTGSGTTVSVKSFADYKAYFTVPNVTPDSREPSKLSGALANELVALVKAFETGYEKILDKYHLSSM
jgi:hypothetical protein